MNQRAMPWVVCIAAISLAMLLFNPAHAQTPQDDKSDSLQQWRSLKYGMFIHFGMSTFTGDELDNGKSPSATYAPTQLDVDQWIRVAKDAGMKYAVLTSKHVAGHCLWDSKVQFRGKEFDYDVATSGNHTDVVAEFVKACKKYDVMPGLYWCPLDYRNNSVPPKQQWGKHKLPDDFYQLAQDQLTELIKNYPDVAYYWLDIPRSASPQQRRALYDLIKRLRPGTVVLFNHGAVKHKGPMTLAEVQDTWPTDVLNTERNPLQAGWFTAQQLWKGRTYTLGYEHCDCIGSAWFWTAKDKPRPAAELFKLYNQVVNEVGGNLLLDVGPDQRGLIDQPRIDALMELKAMIQDHSKQSPPAK